MALERDRNLDRGWAWIISISCGIINALTFGLIRSFGVFFYHIRNDLHLSRETASWPFSLCTAASYLSGPLTGFLVSHFPMRNIVLVGVVLTSLGFLISSLGINIFYINLGIGLVYGLGVGFSFMQTPVILAQYFNKYLATANSISQAGGTVGSFIFTPLLEYLINRYRISGTFLLTSAILLNGIPCGLLFRPPNPSDDDEEEEKEEEKEDKSNDELGVIDDESETPTLLQTNSYNALRYKAKFHFLRKNSFEISNAFETKTRNLYRFMDKQMANQSQNLLLKELLSHDCLSTHQKQVRLMFKSFSETKASLIDICQNDQSQQEEQDTKIELKNFEKFFIKETSPNSGAQYQSRYVQTIPFNKPKIWMDSVKTIFKNPMYLILLTTHVSFQWSWMTYQMIIYDFAIDQNLSSSQSVSLLTFFALSDLFGRFLSGWIADRGLIKKNHTVSICILIIGFTVQITSYFVSFKAQLILANILGFFCGMIIVLFNILSMEYVGLNHFPDALGISAFFVGITSLARPFIIGIFRDVFGSYLGLFQFAGFISFLSALLWLMEPFAILNYKRRLAKQIV